MCNGKGEERDVACSANGELHLALMARAVTADAARHDLAALGDEVLERLRVLVVDDQRLLGAVPADAALAAAPADVCIPIRAAVDVPVVIHHGHGSLLLFAAVVALDAGWLVCANPLVGELVFAIRSAVMWLRLGPEVDEPELLLARLFLLVFRRELDPAELGLL